jgi:hypothetical protein
MSVTCPASREMNRGYTVCSSGYGAMDTSWKMMLTKDLQAHDINAVL